MRGVLACVAYILRAMFKPRCQISKRSKRMLAEFRAIIAGMPFSKIDRKVTAVQSCAYM